MAINRPADKMPSQSGATPRDLAFWGIIAILGGILMVLAQIMVLDPYIPWITLTLGVIMLIWGVATHSVGSLIPGGIVTGIGLGLTLVGPDRIDAGDYGVGLFLIFLALGFLSIPFTTRIFAGRMHWWAFIPGTIIGLLGLGFAFGSHFFQALDLVELGGALALVIFGVWLLYRYYVNGVDED